jgi:hypothetical protein
MTLKATAWLGDKQQQLLKMAGQPPRAAVPGATQKLVMEKSDGPAAFFMLSEAGFDKGAKLKPINKGLEIIHEYLDLKGEPVSKVAVGDEFLVRLRLRATDRDQVQQVAVVDLLPGASSLCITCRRSPKPLAVRKAKIPSPSTWKKTTRKRTPGKRPSAKPS